MPDSIIGRPIDRIDGHAKVTGSALYSADHRADSLVYGSIVTATIGRGQVLAIDTASVRRVPGVLLVLTHENAPRQAPFQAKGEDRHARPKPQLADNHVQYFGQPVALVVAESLEAARAGADALAVTYKREAGAYDLAAARPNAYDPEKASTGVPSDSTMGDVQTALSLGTPVLAFSGS